MAWSLLALLRFLPFSHPRITHSFRLMTVTRKSLHAIYLILAGLLYIVVSRVNPYESCGFDALLLFRQLFPFFLTGAVVLFFLGKAWQSLKTMSVCNLFMAIPLSLVLHGVCEHTSYSYLQFWALIQSFYYLPSLLTLVYKKLTFCDVLCLLLFLIVLVYILIWGPSFMHV